MTKTPWVHVAHKDGKFAGAISHDSGQKDPKQRKSWQKEVAKFCGDFIADGFTITTTYSREEYTALIEGMPIWKPEKVKPPASQLSLDDQSLIRAAALEPM